MSDRTIVHDEVVPARRPWSRVIAKGEHLRIVDLEGRQAVDFLVYNAADPTERYFHPNTIKKAGTILLTTGHVLYSDYANPLMTIVGDTFGGHDTIGGCCSKWSNRMLYGVANTGCRENFLEALAAHGLGWRDIVPNINWFMSVPVGAAGEAAIALGASKAGDHVELRAEMDVLAVISNCPQVLNPCNDFNPTPIQVVVTR
ncbi:MAG: DUF1989 domain-containing protein [Hyphomicrobiaceae bacterium]